MSEGIRARFRIERGAFALDVDFALPGQGVSALFGQSGSGKTTCLRAMAGLERAPGGFFSVGGEVWQDEARGLFLPPHRRPVGMVFQDAGLFPHLSVHDNLIFGQKRAARPGPLSADALSELLGIGHLRDRAPQTLSGGERQRVAIARALLAAPKILLMDEPLAALDIGRRQEILPYLECLHRELAIPVVYVSHAPDEVARLADHMVLFQEGCVLAAGPLNAVMARLDLPPALADDAGVVLNATVVAHEADDLTLLSFAGGEIRVSRRPEAPGSSLRCRIHARDVSLALLPPQLSSILNCVAATVVDLATTDTPGHVLVSLDVAGTPLLARITRRSAERLAIRSGLRLHAQIKSVALLA